MVLAELLCEFSIRKVNEMCCETQEDFDKGVTMDDDLTTLASGRDPSVLGVAFIDRKVNGHVLSVSEGVQVVGKNKEMEAVFIESGNEFVVNLVNEI
jgi:hypothetical protein